ncbi:MAG: hypothetical protein HOP30_19255 [Cyclobacteriaceae bacterium]|nr:hypothetical protein [Cyclobacteriaceae bacterium]
MPGCLQEMPGHCFLLATPAQRNGSSLFISISLRRCDRISAPSCFISHAAYRYRPLLSLASSLKIISPPSQIFSHPLKIISPSLKIFSSSLKIFSPSLKIFSPSLKIFSSSLKIFSSSLKIFSSSLKIFSPSLKILTANYL